MGTKIRKTGTTGERMSGKGATSDSSPNDDADNQSGEDSDGFMRPGAQSNLHHRENIEFDMEAEYDEETLAQLPFIVRLVARLFA